MLCLLVLIHESLCLGNSRKIHISNCPAAPANRVDVSSDMTISECSFENIYNNSESAQGGAIYIKDSLTVTVEKSNFTNIKIDGTFASGGAIYALKSSVTYNTCLFDNCSSKYIGGAVANEKCPLTLIELCTFSKCSSNSASACKIHYDLADSPLRDSADVKNCSFLNCFHQTSGDTDDFCTLALDFKSDDTIVKGNVLGCKFYGLKEFAILCEASVFSLNDTVFEEVVNEQQDHSACVHCLLASISTGNFYIVRTNFINCQTQDYGMMNVPNVALYMEECLVKKCKSNDIDKVNAHGFMITDNDITTQKCLLLNVNFTENECTNEGAGLYVNRATIDLTLDHCNFFNNKIVNDQGSNYGASFHIKSSGTLSVNHTIFTFLKENDATSVVIENKPTVTISNSCFNSSGTYSNNYYHMISSVAIKFDATCFTKFGDDSFKFVEDQEWTGLFGDCEQCKPFDECPDITQRNEYRGKLGQTLSVRIHYCSFYNLSDSTADQLGGALYLLLCDSLLQSCTFTKIYCSGASSRGGAVYTDSSSITYKKCTFIDCKSGEMGGAMYNEYPQKCDLIGCTFQYCYSRNASAAKINYQTPQSSGAKVPPFHIEQCIFKNCNMSDISPVENDYFCTLAIDLTGTVLDSIVTATLNNCVFQDIGEFAVLSEVSYFDVINTSFTNVRNPIEGHASCIHCLLKSINVGSYKIHNTTFSLCQTKDFGVMNIPFVNLTMTDCTVYRCDSNDTDQGINAHGIMITDDSELGRPDYAYIANCVFDSNSAGNGGAGIFMDRVNKVVILNGCVFKDNSVKKSNAKYGVNLHCENNGTIMMIECNFKISKLFNNKGSSNLKFNDLTKITMQRCALDSTGYDNYTFQIVSNTEISFLDFNCYNNHTGDNKIDFDVKDLPTNPGKNLTYVCADNIPTDECKSSGRYEYTTDFLHLNRCNFSNITQTNANTNGGVIYMTFTKVGNLGILLVKHCNFLNIKNNATGCNGGAIYSTNCNSSIVDSIFSQCVAYDYAGAVYSNEPSSSEIISTSFDSCSAGYCSAIKHVYNTRGSGWTPHGEATFNKVTITSCDATGTDEHKTDYICALSLDFATVGLELEINATLIDVHFDEIRKHFAILSECKYMTIIGCSFIDCENSIQNRAACIHCIEDSIKQGHYVMHDVLFLSCSSDDYGVMNIPNVKLDMQNCRIQNNQAFDSDTHMNAHGLMITDSDNVMLPVYLNNNTFSGNNVANGGALYIDRYEKNITMTNCHFANNVVVNGQKNYGASLMFNGDGPKGYAYIYNCSFQIKKVSDSPNIAVFGLETCIIYQCCFNTQTFGTITSTGHIVTNVNISFYPNNCFNDLGDKNFKFEGAQPSLDNINFDCDSSCLPITECPRMGEGIEAVNKLVNLQNCRFNNVRSDKKNGGAVSVIDGYVKISYCMFIYCQGVLGGAVYLENSTVYVEQTQFLSCSALKEAGGVYLQQPNVTHFDTAIFSTDSAVAVGALTVNAIPDYDPDNDFTEIPQVTIFTNCIFKYNKMSAEVSNWAEDRCALSLVFDSSFTVLNTTIINTTFDSNDCFGIYCLASYLTLKNTTFSNCNNNNSQNCASCVYCDLNVIHMGAYVIDNVSFIDCITNDYGVMNVPNVELNMTNSIVKNCTSHDTDMNLTAHGFMITDNDHTIYHVNLINNTFDSTKNGNGGALYIDRKYKEIEMNNCNFIFNVKTGDAGSENFGANLMIKGSEEGYVHLTNCQFQYKKTNDASSVYISVGSKTSITMDQCCFKSQGNGKSYKTAFNIYTDVKIYIINYMCMTNNTKDGPNYIGLLDASQINLNCDDECIPKEDCKKERAEYDYQKFNLNGCSYGYMESSGKATEGGAVRSESSYVILNKCQFTGVKPNLTDPNSSGGAVYLLYCVSTIKDCNFKLCNAVTGGALSIIYPLSSIINNSKFYNNVAKQCCAIQLKKNIASWGSASRSSDWRPDGTESSDRYQFINTIFSYNRIDTMNNNFDPDYFCILSLDWEMGEGFANFTAVIQGCTFNGATGAYGVLCESGYLELTDTNFTGIQNSYQGHSSCVYSLVDSVSDGFYTIKNVRFENCVTQDFGVMNIPCVSVDMRDCYLNDCTTMDNDKYIEGHGIMITDSDNVVLPVNIVNVTFKSMKMISGGALYIDRALKDVTVLNCLFDSNVVTSVRNCGANIHVVGKDNTGKLKLSGCRFNYVKTTNVSSIYINETQTPNFRFTLENCCFNTKARNFSDYTPAHIYSTCPINVGPDNCFNNDPTVMFNEIPGFNASGPNVHYNCDSDCIPVTECQENYDSKGVRLNLHNCSFRNIDAFIGVPIRLERGVLLITFCAFANISGAGDGGSIYSEQCENHILNSRFIKCNSTLSGGAILMRKTNYTLMKDCTFTRCSSVRGAACWVDILPDPTQGVDSKKNPKNVTISGCDFKGCISINSGRPDDADYYCTLAVDFDSSFTNTDFNLTECFFADNTGFGVLSEASFMNIKNVYFTNLMNGNQGHASCIHCLTGSINFGNYLLENVTFLQCSTQDFGVMNVPNVALNMTKCLIYFCSAYDSDLHKDAHGFMITDTDQQLLPCIIDNCTFEYNEGNNGGGGLYIDRRLKDITIQNCLFNQNTASYNKDSKNYGANLQIVNDGKVMIRYCKFIFNKNNDACSVMLKGVTSVTLDTNCFQSTTWSKFTSAIHLVSDQTFTVYGVQCFNNVTNAPMFQFAPEQPMFNIMQNCDDNCYEKSTCPKEGERVTEDDGGTLNLKKCTFANSYYTGKYDKNEGGAVIFLTRSTVIIRDSKFLNNTATLADAGCIYIYMVKFMISDTTFTQCVSGSQCGALYDIYPAQTTMENVIFDNCSALKTSAGKITFSATWSSTDTVILKNVHVINTAASTMEVGTEHDNCFAVDYFNDFNPNDQDEDDTVLKGYLNATIIDCVFEKNYRFALLLETSYLTMINTYFQYIDYSGEKQQNHSSCIHVITKTIRNGQYDIKNCSFLYCNTNDFGVMNFPAVALNMEDCIMKRCVATDTQATNGHGISITDDDVNGEMVTITRCQFIGTETISGGAVYIDREDKRITFTDCTFASNVVLTPLINVSIPYIGANIMAIGQGFVTLEGCQFTYVSTRDIPSNTFKDLTRVTINGCCFKATVYGSTTQGVHLYSSNSAVTFGKNNCYNDVNNSFLIVGLSKLPGPPYLNTKCQNCQPIFDCNDEEARRNIIKSQAYFYKCTFQRISYEFGNGGVIYAEDSIIKIEKCTFRNTKANSGACAYLYGCDTKVLNCSVAEATSAGDGAFVAVYPTSTLFFSTNFSYCTASMCAAIRIMFTPDYDPDNDEEEIPQTANITLCSVRDCSVEENKDDMDYKCAIGLDAPGESSVIQAFLLNITIQNIEMFGVLSEMSFLTIRDSIFDNIRAEMQGHASAVHCLSETVHFGDYTLTNVSFTSCLTQDFGVMNVPNVLLYMENCVVKDCSSYDDDEHTRAHGFMITDNDDLLEQIMISNCLFQNNDAANGGAGLYIDRKDKDISIMNCVFKNNQVTYDEDSSKYGANLQVSNSGIISLDNCEFIFEKLNGAASVWFDRLDQIYMARCCFTSTGKSVDNTVFHIVSTSEIFFNGFSCFNDMKNNFIFTRGQDQVNIAFNCKDLCEPTDDCPTKRVQKNFGKFVLYQCTFENIITTGSGLSGGVIKGSSLNLLIDSCLFTVVKATGKDATGGAIDTDNSQNVIRNSKFIKCESALYGGAVNIIIPSSANFSNNVFSYCVSKRSSAVRVQYNQYGFNNGVFVDSCIFKDCSCKNIDDTDYYCALSLDFEQWRTVVNASVTNCQFTDLKTFGILLEASYFNLTNTVFQNCVCDQQNLCSCVYVQVLSVRDGIYYIHNTSFVECQTEDFGIINIPNVKLDMRDCQVLRCTSTDSDNHIDAHGVMITDNDASITMSYIVNCIFQENVAGNGGAGLFINRKSLIITIESCQFLQNQVTYDADSAKYGANLQLQPYDPLSQSEYPQVSLNLCKFVFDKVNKASNIMILNRNANFVINSSCFTSNGKGETPFHIVSDAYISFRGTNCFNDKGKYNFQFATEQSNVTFNFDCADNCLPQSYCPMIPGMRYPNSTGVTINLIDCQIVGVSVSGDDGNNGGALYAKNCKLYLTNCVFQDCSAPNGNGGAIHSDKTQMTVLNTKFISCHAKMLGGAVDCPFSQYGIDFQDCFFIRCNSSQVSALRVMVPDDDKTNDKVDDPFVATIINCLFKENFASQKQDYYCSVCVECTFDLGITTIMKGCRFLDMNNYGMFSENVYFTLQDTIFQNLNSTSNTNFASAVHCNTYDVSYGEYTIINTSFIKCSSDDFGVMNVPNVGLKMKTVLVQNCQAFDADEHKDAHGFMITDDDDQLYPIMIEDCVFENNDGANGGGGLYIDRRRKDVTIYNCQFLNNMASYNANSLNYGSNLQVVGIGMVNITKCKFVSDKQRDNDASSLRFENLTRITIVDCCFKETGYKANSCYYIASNTNITFLGVQCITNKSTNNQIMFNFTEGQVPPALDANCDDYCIPNKTCPYNKRSLNEKILVNIANCHFENMGSTSLAINGGAIYCTACILYVRNTYFQNCYLSGMGSSGGAIYLIKSEMHLISNKFATCISDSIGGAVETVFPNVTDVQSCQFVRCSSKKASALHINITPEYNTDDDEFEVPQVAVILGCTFRDNYHTKSPGGSSEDYYCTMSVDFDSDSTNLNTTIKDTQFLYSKEFAVLSESTTFHMENVVFRGVTNDIQGHASCVHCLPDSIHLGTYIIKNTTFTDCVTQDFGVMNVPNVALNMTNCLITRCNASDSDQHIAAHGFMITDNDDLLFPVYVVNCVFEGNDGANGGAGLFIDRKLKNIIIQSCKFANNQASYNPNSANYGVNLQVEGSGKISITKCKFDFNKLNDAVNVRFQGLDDIILNNNCFISNGVGNTPFHIVSNTIITFEGSQHCFNQKGNYNFQLPTGQKIPDTVKFTCDEYCVPADTCPTKQATSYGAVVNIFKCKFNGIKSMGNGGVINSMDGVIHIIESTFNDCTASSGGAASAITSEIHCIKSSFTNCVGSLYTGGLYIIDPNVTEIQGCTFTNCQSKRVTALYISFVPDYIQGNDEDEIPQYASVVNCQFSKCKNTKAEDYYLDYYCTVSLDFQDDATVVNSTVMNCSFTDNTGFGILSELTYFQLINTVFTRQNNDKAGNHSSCVHCLTETVHFGEYDIINSSFIECSTDDYGVMNVPNVKLTLKDSLVSKCTTTDSDTHINAHGFMITDDDDLLEQIQVTNCVFSDNNCANGGALYINRKLKDILIDSCTFTNNKATYTENSDKYGASLQVEGNGKVRLNECKFEFEKVNKATSVRFEGLDTIQMGRCCFKTKATSKDGYFNIWADKRIAFVDYMCFNTIDGVSNDKLNYFTGNQDTEQFSYNCDEYCIPLNECPSGQKSRIGGETINLKGCQFIDSQPGIVQIMMGRLIIRDSVFKPKQLAESNVPASAIIARSSDMFIYNTVFEKCVTGSNAGAIVTAMSNITVIEGCRFSECANKLVAAISLDMVADTDASNDMTEVPKLANLTGCTFTKCSHPDYDPQNAKFYCTLSANTGSIDTVVELNLISCTFEDIQGFGVLSTASFMTMRDTTFKNITHDKQNFASCVHVPPDYVHFGTYTITNTKFLNCMTQDYGVMNVPNVGLHMISCTVSNCVALDSDQSINGHGFMITDDDDLLYPVVIDSCTFEGNDGANGGAGLYIDRKQKSIFVSNCQFRNNKASHDAGSNNYGVNVQVVGTGYIKLSKCQFDFQKTNQASSLQFTLLSQIIIDSCNFNSEGVSGSPYHIVSNTIIMFQGVNCMNNKGEFNFKFADGQATTGISFTCSGGGGGDDSQNQGSGSGVSPGGMAGIIIAVVAIIAIAAVAVIVFMIKKGMFGRKEDSEVYHADKEVSYSEAMSTATFETANAEHVFDDEL